MPTTDTFNVAQLTAELARDEGRRLFAYDDGTGLTIVKGHEMVGLPTIGVGRCLTTKGVSNLECDFLFGNDVTDVAAQLDVALPWWRQLEPTRQRALLNMAFNLGTGGLLTFRSFLSLMSAGRYADAANSLTTTLWWHQVGNRASRISLQIASGGQ